MLQTEDGKLESEANFEFASRYESVLRELGVAAHYMLDCIDKAIQQLPADPITGRKSFTTASLSTIVSDIKRFPSPYPFSALFQMAKCELAGETPDVIEQFVEMNFAVLLWVFLMRSELSWRCSKNVKPFGFELYNMQFVECTQISSRDRVAIASKHKFEDEEQRKRATRIVRAVDDFYWPKDGGRQSLCPFCNSPIEIRSFRDDDYSSCECGKCNENLRRLFAPESI